MCLCKEPPSLAGETIGGFLISQKHQKTFFSLLSTREDETNRSGSATYHSMHAPRPQNASILPLIEVDERTIDRSVTCNTTKTVSEYSTNDRSRAIENAFGARVLLFSFSAGVAFSPLLSQRFRRTH